MHCPDCGTLNDAKPRYCRNCGRSLVAIPLALDGRIDEAVARFKKSEDTLAAGLLIFAIFMVGAILALFTQGPRPFSFSVLLGLIVALPFVITGLVRVDRVRRLMEPTGADAKQLGVNKEMDKALPARSTDRLEIDPELRGSVTDRTTLHLNQKKAKIRNE